MGKPRKTVMILSLLEEVNGRNRLSTCSPDFRVGWNMLLDTVLHNANAYAGFAYLNSDEVPEGQLPGTVVNERGERTFPDDTRRHYYTALSLGR